MVIACSSFDTANSIMPHISYGRVRSTPMNNSGETYREKLPASHLYIHLLVESDVYERTCVCVWTFFKRFSGRFS